MSYNNQNQIISKTNKQGKTQNYTYDKNGNILSDGKKSYTYTSFNKIKTILKDDKLLATLQYDSFNNLVLKTQGTKKSYFIDNISNKPNFLSLM